MFINNYSIRKQIENIKISIRYPACFIAFGFGTGLIRIVPGTLSTILVGIPLHHLLQTFSKFYYSIILLFFIFAGVLVCSIAEEVLETTDDPIIVWDEICGYLLTMLITPGGLPWSMLGLLLFRIFDIFKPWPIHIVDQKIKGGIGIMLDDILAGIYASILLYLIHYFL